MDKKILYQKNPARIHRSFYEQESASSWQPEHERLNIKPILKESFEEDFMLNRRNNAPAQRVHVQAQTSVPVSGAQYTPPWQDGGQPEFSDANVPAPPATPFSHNPGVMTSAPQAPQAARPVSSNSGSFFENQVQTEANDKTQMSAFEKISPGDICVFVDDNLIFATANVEKAEQALNHLLFDKQIEGDRVTVMQRLSLKIGASIE